MEKYESNDFRSESFFSLLFRVKAELVALRLKPFLHVRVETGMLS